jgi:hypothetical protein
MQEEIFWRKRENSLLNPLYFCGEIVSLHRKQKENHFYPKNLEKLLFK